MTKCEHCGGQVFREQQLDGTDEVCLQCGHRKALGWQPVVRLPRTRGPVVGSIRSHKKKVSA